MKKKYYILVLTFLCLFLGQASYGQDLNEGYVPQWIQDYVDAGGTVIYYSTIEEYANGQNSDDNVNNDVIDVNGNGKFDSFEVASSLLGFQITDVTSLAGETAYVLSDGSLFLLSNLLDEVVVISGIPPDTEPVPIVPTDPELPDPEPDPAPCPSGDFCECYGVCDTNPDLVKEPCTKTCPSGYKLNINTCGCELLPPCFGTTVEGLIPDGTADKNGLVEALKTMVNSFFKSSDLLDTMKKFGVLDSEELSKGFDNYIKAGDILGKLSVGFVLNDYDNNPTTENFMKIFVEGAVAFLPAPAALGYTVADTFSQKYLDTKPFSDILAKKMAEKSAELFDCDLGSGVYGIFH